MRFLALALLLVAPIQDDAKIQELILKLDDAEFDTREAAFQALVKIGPKAVAALEKARDSSESAEVKQRTAEAIKAIDLAEKASKVYREPARINAEFERVPVATVLEEVAKQAGVRIEGSTHIPEHEYTCKFKDVTMFEALDQICSSFKQLTYEHRTEGVVTLVKEVHPAAPCAYVGPFRVRLQKLTITRESDFKATTVMATAVLVADYEQHLKPLSKVKYEVTKVIDDTGAEVAVSKNPMGGAKAMAGGAMVIMAGGGLGGFGEELERTFMLAGFAPGAAGIKSLAGTATFLFPLTQTIVKFDTPSATDVEESGDCVFKIASSRGRYFEIEIGRAKSAENIPQEEVDRRLDTESFILVDGDGKEAKPESVTPGGSNTIVVGPGGVIERKVRLRVSFAVGVKVQSAKELRFRFVDKTLEKVVPFELKDVKIP